jgi:hypothetical protein
MRGYLEVPDERTMAVLDAVDYSALRKRFFDAIIDDGYLGPDLEDFSLIPRVFPAAYMRVIEDAALNLTRAILTLASKDKQFILKHLPADERWNILINRHGILDQTPARLVGELRYDFAIAGPLTEANPPQLMEINGAALGLYAFASFLPKTLKALVDLEHLTYTDVAENFVDLCRRVGPHIASFFPGNLFWGDHLLAQAMDSLHLITPVDVPNAHLWPRLRRADWRFDDDGKLSLFIDGTWQRMDGFRWARVFTLRDIEKFGDLLAGVMRSPATLYMSHPRVEFSSNKGVLPLLCDARFLKRELGVAEPEKVTRYVTPSRSLADAGFPKRADWKDLVIKHNFGSGGDGVFVGEAIATTGGRVDDPAAWIVQDRHELNQMYARLLFTSDRPVRMDLGVFVNYDFADGELKYLRVGGVVARGSNRQLVNVTQGGAAIPVLWPRDAVP